MFVWVVVVIVLGGVGVVVYVEENSWVRGEVWGGVNKYFGVVGDRGVEGGDGLELGGVEGEEGEEDVGGFYFGWIGVRVWEVGGEVWGWEGCKSYWWSVVKYLRGIICMLDVMLSLR